MKHPEWVGGKPPAAVGGCCGRVAALPALRRVENAPVPSDSDGWRPPSLWAKSARMQTRPGDAAALARRPQREKAAATRTRRGDQVRCARGKGGKVAARPQQGGGHGFGAGGCGRQNRAAQTRMVGGKPPWAVGGCRWLGGCRGCVVPRLAADVSGRVEGTASGMGACRAANVGGIAGAGWRGTAPLGHNLQALC